MGKIHQLTPEIVAKIAAGEVIERPSYAVKELIENSIDAQSSDIQIFIEDSGLKKIQIIDNGEGMSKEDLLKCFMPHTTSKLSEKDSLIGIKSMGFRGEALSSLSAISDLTIKSRTKESPTGEEIEIKNSKLTKSAPCGMAKGTIVIAQNLFAQIPARKKFLKSNSTEFRHIVEVINHFALAYPKIRFILKHNNRVVIDFPSSMTRKERITNILGKNNFHFFLPIKESVSHLSFSGYIAKPQFHSSTQSRQILFVNNRRVTDKLISLSVKEAFGNMLESTSYPLFILFLQVPFEMVDVNVHPRKENVVFFNNQFIFQTLKEKVIELLQDNNITFQNLSWKREGFGTTNTFASNMLRKNVLDKESLIPRPQSPISQIRNLYIFSESKNNIVLTDQHAAHERILFEKLKKEFLKQKKLKKSYQLKDPFVLNLSQNEKLLLSEYQKLFKKLGYVIYSTSKNSKTVITHIPFIFQDRNPQELVKDLLENLEEDRPLKKIDKVSEEMLSFLACRAAVKAGDTLNEIQMRKILEDLDKTESNITCPHGRPTQIVMSLKDLDKLFKR
ncbi:MAG TPA: DNA mismatch repair endonuclease MutL [Patescibacteria group bacterium]